MWKRAPEGSIPSVLKGNIMRVCSLRGKCLRRLSWAVVLTLMARL